MLDDPRIPLGRWESLLCYGLFRGAAVSAMLLTMGCSSNPSFGPSDDAIAGAATQVVGTSQDVLPFRIVEVTASSISSIPASGGGFPESFRSQALAAMDDTVQVSDRLEFRIWEGSENGLFTSPGSRETTLQATVSNSGQISVPYAGMISVVGMTTSQVRDLLLERFRGQAVEPEIAVTISEISARTATVLGEVASPGRQTIQSRGVRLLDLLAEVGGTGHSPWETSITLRRGRASATALLSDVLHYPPNNVVVLPGDNVSVEYIPRRFAVYGAIKRPGNIEVPTERAHLAFLLAEVGGLDDRVAEAGSIFVFRQTSGQIATAFRFDFARPDILLLAGMFEMKPTDITYVASADVAEFEKFVSLTVSPFLRPVSTISSLAQ